MRCWLAAVFCIRLCHMNMNMNHTLLFEFEHPRDRIVTRRCHTMYALCVCKADEQKLFRSGSCSANSNNTATVVVVSNNEKKCVYIQIQKLRVAATLSLSLSLAVKHHCWRLFKLQCNAVRLLTMHTHFWSACHSRIVHKRNKYSRE